MHDTHARRHHPTLCRRQAFWLMWSVNTPPPPFKGLQSLPRTHFMYLHCKKVECVKCACGHRGGAGYCSCCTDTGMCFAGFACVQREELEACCTPLSRLNSSKASTSLNPFVSNCIKPNYSAPPGNHGQQSYNEQLHLKKLNGFSFTVG